jgi:uncharacterized protein Yka (UPF0111/DUF47 family)
MKPLYQRVAEISDELEKMKLHGLVNELNDICDTIDQLDDEVYSILLDVKAGRETTPKIIHLRKTLYGHE